MYAVSSMLYLFAVIALVIGVVLMLTVVVQTEDELDSHDDVNTTRSNLFLLLALTLAAFVLVQQRFELRSVVTDALQM